VLRRALAAVIVATVVVAGAATPGGGRWRGTDGGHLWSGAQQLALTHGSRTDLQTLQGVRARGKLTAAGLPNFLANTRAGAPSSAWYRYAWNGPRAAHAPNLVPASHRHPRTSRAGLVPHRVLNPAPSSSAPHPYRRYAVNENEALSSEESPKPSKLSVRTILVLVAIGLGFALLLALNMK
jgi:hypothetical protein